MAIQFSNLASTVLASGVSNSATSVSVSNASLFPSLGAGDYFYATIGLGSGSEIVKVTAVSGTTFTVVRGQDNTSAVSHLSGEELALRVTAKSLEDIRDSVGTAISNLVDTAPATLDTLNELAAALGDDPNFATTVASSIATKLPLAGGTLTGNLTVSATYPKLQLNDTTGIARNFSVGTNNETFTIRNETAGSDSLTIFNDNNATFAGTISSGAITTTSDITLNGGHDIHLVKTHPNNAVDMVYGQITFGDATSGQYVNHARIESGGGYANNTDLRFHTSSNDSSPVRFQMTNIGEFKVGTTTILDQSRNLTNISTISSGAITAGGTTEVTASEFRITSSAAYITHLNYNNTGNNIISQAIGGATSIRNNAGNLFTIGSDGTVNINTGALQLGGTTVIDSSRSATFTSLDVAGNIKFGNSTNRALLTSNAVYSYIGQTNLGTENPESNSAYFFGINPRMGADRTLVVEARTADGAGAIVFKAGSGSYSTGAPERMRIYSDGTVNINTGALQLGGTTVIDSSRNLTNIGTISSGNISAPIFYDSNDTGYLLDPNGTSNLNTVNMQGVFNANAGSRIVVQNGFDGGNARGLFMWMSNDPNWGIYMGQAGAGRSLSGGTAPSALNGGAAHQVRFRVANSVTQGFVWENASEITLMSLQGSSGDLYTRDSVRSPVFYDSNNTGYYVDPAGISNLSQIMLNGVAAPNLSSSAYFNAAFQVRESAFNGAGTDDYIQAPRLGFHWSGRVASQIGLQSSGRIAILDNPGSGYADFAARDILGDVSMRSPIFYDSANTGYYVDPNGTSNLNAISATSINVAGTVTSDGITIRDNQWFYAGNGADLKIGHDGIAANIIRSQGHPLYIDSNGINFRGYSPYTNHMSIQADGTVDITGGVFRKTGSLGNVIINTNGNELSFTRDAASYIDTPAASGNLVIRTGTSYASRLTVSNGYVLAHDQMRSPIFYDSNDTAYYTDPNGTSSLNLLNVNTSGAGNGSPQQMASFVNVGTGATSSYATFSASSGLDWRVGKNPAGTAGNTNFGISTHVGTLVHQWDGSGNSYASGSSRAPIFYDSIDTAYLLDPNGTSNVYQLGSKNLGVNTGGSSTTKYGLSLYSGAATNPVYGIMFTGTAGSGQHGAVNTDWATYFTMNNSAGRGWIFRDNSTPTNVASISNQGHATFNGRIINPSIWINDGTSTGSWNENIRLYDTSQGVSTIVFGASAGSGSGAGRHAFVSYPDNLAFFYGESVQERKYNGYSLHTGSYRAPIFYDSDNTGYYVDPNGTSNVNFLQAVRYQRTAHNNGYLVGGYNNVGASGGKSSPIYSIGSAYAANDTNLGNLYGIGYSTYSSTLTGVALTGATDWGMYVAASGLAKIWLDGYNGNISTIGNVYAPIVYDFEDTNFYANPASKSSFNALQINGSWGQHTLPEQLGIRGGYPSICFRSSTSNSVWLRHMDGAGDIQHYYAADGLDAGNWTVKHSMDSSGNFTSNGSLRAPIFYDSVDTSYYLDPASPSVLGMAKFNKAVGATGGSATAVVIKQAGAAEISFGSYPASWTSAFQIQNNGNTDFIWMSPLDDGYSARFRTGGSGLDFYTDGANDTGTYSAYIGAGSVRSPIFYDLGDTSYYVDPNGLTNLYNLNLTGAKNTYLYINPGVGHEAMVRYNGGTGSGWYQGKRTANDLVGSDGFQTFSELAGRTLFGVDPAGNSISYASSRAPLFYDSNNTTYYVDPNSVSSVYGMAIRGDQGATDSANQIFFWGSDVTTSAIGFKASGGEFPNPTGNGDGYNTYLTMDTPGRGWVFRQGVGGTDFSSANTSGWILNNGVWQANSSMRAPMFYDSNNTAYYVDPSANSYLYGSTYGGLSIGEPPTNHGGWDRQLTLNGSGHSRITAKTADKFMGIYAHDTWHNGGGGYVGTYSNHNVTFIQNAASVGYIDTGKNLQWNGGGDIRAPFFYDSNNTAYYLDPTDTSRLGYVRPNSISCVGNADLGTPRWDFKAYVVESQHHYGHNGSQTMYIGESNPVMIPGDCRSPIFYDYNNTAYYVDPNSTGTSVNVAGSIIAGGNITAYSDRRVKENIEPITNALNKVQQLNGVTFNRIDLSDKTKRYAGLIAQDIEKVLPEAVDDDVIKRVDYNATIGLLVEAIKELTAKVETLETKLAQKEQ